LLTQPNVDRNQIIYAGWSLGGAVAIDLAARRPPLKLITFSTFTSMANMAQRTFLGLPTSFMVLTYRFDRINKIRTIACPILLFHGTSDQWVPDEMTDELAGAALPGKAKVVKIPGDHFAIFDDGGAIWDEVSEFVHSPPER
jgi:pimeloyl-ACP methyl ester carboxylesterase